MKEVFKIGLHIGYWLFFTVLVAVIYTATQVNGVNGPKFEKLLVLIFGFLLLPSFISFYSSYFFIFRLYVKKTGTIKLLVFLFFSLLISSLVAIVSIYVLVDTPRVFLEVGIVSFFLNGFNAFIGFILHSFISWFKDVKEKEELNQKTKVLELEMIKLKLDPHFLFNTINNIDVLIETDTPKASEYIAKLSSILRFYLYKTSDSLISLKDELKYIHEYVELQKIRTSNKDFITINTKGNPSKKKIAPMVLIPFIENAFKHSLNKKTDAIDIQISIQNSQIIFRCSNKINEVDSQEKGIGNQLIEKRLKLIYGDNYSMRLNISDNNYVVNLNIPV
ncbi:MAG: sensor histidine kinase [Flavobacteriaceae bacterium]|nr:sensor histidine kinase [Flavobacteriaceae bacterium]